MRTNAMIQITRAYGAVNQLARDHLNRATYSIICCLLTPAPPPTNVFLDALFAKEIEFMEARDSRFIRAF